MIRVLFVCLGNICRSPMAEGLFIRLIKEAQLTGKVTCDSAGTNSYHIGELPDRRMMATARDKGIELTSRARAFKKEDARQFDYIICMDTDNLQMARSIAKVHEGEGQFYLMRHFDPLEPGANVPDPWYGDQNDFENCYDMLNRCVQRLVDFIRERNQL